MEKRETFVQAVSKELVGEFLQFVQLDKEASDPFSLNELLDELSRKQKEELWQRLKNLLTDVLLESPVDGWQVVEAQGEDNMETEHGSKMRKSIEIIYAITSVILASVSVINESENYEALLECVIILNGILYALPESERKLQSSIQDLCVTWWEKGLPAKEDTGKTAFVMLLRRSLETKTGADVCRLWRIHQALYCFDYDLEESGEIKDMLLECFININYIKKEEGRRFLSCLFNWNINFIKMIHGTIKNQLQGLQKSLMVYIAEIYFRAWKKASGKILEAIENDCIQDFMFHGIHLPRRSPVHSKVREVLSYFHHQKKVRQGVEEMLYRLYKPILWRGLKARNSEVRSNAALLFVEAFPIRDPNLHAIEMDSEIQKQFEELYSLLEDPYPMVRSTGILGVCKITSKYWEMMPPTILIDLLKKVTGELAFDTSSADVRCSVFKCLPMILDNKLSHPLLEQLLPALRYSLHDNSEKVRVAFVDMLLKIKAVRAAKFWKICPMEHILVRLETDSRPVSRRLVSLIFNSFLPVNQPEEVWCERCVTLVQMNHAAARRFYQYAHEHTACTNIAKLIHVIRHCLNACIQRAVREPPEDEEEEDGREKENVTVLDKTLSVNDVACMAGLLEIIVILWKSIDRSMENNKEAKLYTINKFASVLPEYLKVFKDDRCKIPLFMLMSFMPASAVPPFSCGVISTLRSREEGAVDKSYCTLLDCLCSWGQVGHILELVDNWLPTEHAQAKSNTASKGRVQIHDTRPVKPELALVYIEYLLTHPKNRECLLSAPRKKLNHLLKALETSKADLESLLQTPGGKPRGFSEAAAPRAFGLHCRLSIHLQHKFCSEGKVYLSMLEDTGFWLESKILSFIQDQEEDYLKLHRVIYQQIIQTYLTVCKDVVMVGLGDHQFQMQLLQRSLGIMQTVKGFFYVSLLLDILKEITGSSLIQKTDSDEEVAMLLDTVQKVFQKMLECIARSFRKQPEEGLRVSDVEELTPPEHLSDLPPFSRCLIGIIIKSSNVVRSFLDELKACVASNDIEGIVCLTAAVHIILVINAGKHKSSKVREVAATVHRKLKTFMEITLEEDSIERFLYESSSRTLGELLNS
ncbi:condensin-2 complex subunit G2 isoform X5 [Homo sapiens]|uniref:condensin-2 complex subunit G2 isoform X5 n=2 Tax=Homo sapiens TaxID=9606 RepID=UPI0000EE7635|nr:condensin-2 complex subunit G2 isoform X5 [Homo sapiens]XP_047276500.1 condensin-2 complex subunit G2 isoform X5 [Homo sapiens]XP_047276501.1 condensin-2 complex subunit G2 isoform X5 [Homo sapiens]XP_054214500.1 condensin-2 complex subunit G2 isoform X5 [Homo sapiens]XP_054214501.1 condensin-2 complex subunit G2 isoform X5 [Homo sapiens]XP_054214502.1 condensin-2 complex subunit G2 isoform X5 [Homo sapiens]EAX04585.1 leucine zipper protein 5, isoform CRA_a [Homo sapiens]|eukprot:XP_005249604.1 condensin-2 complex subunit G2 isoform X4 [Homo sapiens]